MGRVIGVLHDGIAVIGINAWDGSLLLIRYDSALLTWMHVGSGGYWQSLVTGNDGSVYLEFISTDLMRTVCRVNSTGKAEWTVTVPMLSAMSGRALMQVPGDGRVYIGGTVASPEGGDVIVIVYSDPNASWLTIPPVFSDVLVWAIVVIVAVAITILAFLVMRRSGE